MIKKTVLNLLKENLQEIRKFKILKLAIFGSVARDQDTPQSDIDILIGFDGPPSYDLYMELKFFLEDLLGRKVDLVTENSIREEIKQFIEMDLIHVA